MFGQEPRLPIDFLLARVQDPVNGGVHEWIQEHQARLQIAFDGARERLKTAAERRKNVHDQHLRGEPLKEGQLVFLCDFSARGRHKMQDLWGSTVYSILRVPKEGGAVYTIAPKDDQSNTKNVHRTPLKAVIGVEPPGCAAASHPAPPDRPVSESSGDGDLLLLVPEAAPLSTLPATRAIAEAQTTPQVPRHLADLVPTEPGPSMPSVIAPAQPAAPLVIPSTSSSDTSNMAPRRSARSTAGQHSNVHRIPRPVGDLALGAVNSQGSVSHAVIAFYRPWSWLFLFSLVYRRDDDTKRGGRL